MNFTKEQIDYIKKAVDHVDFLTGGSRNSKTKQIIEELQQENTQLKDKIEKAVEHIKNIDKYEETLNDDTRVYMVQDVDVDEIERILKEN